MDEHFITITINHFLSLPPEARLPALFQNLSLDGFSEAWMDVKFKEKREELLKSCRDFIQGKLTTLERVDPDVLQQMSRIKQDLYQMGHRVDLQNPGNLEKSICDNSNLAFPSQFEIVKTTALHACNVSLVDGLASIDPEVSNRFKKCHSDWRMNLEKIHVEFVQAQAQLARLNQELSNKRPSEDAITPVSKKRRINLPTPQTCRQPRQAAIVARTNLARLPVDFATQESQDSESSESEDDGEEGDSEEEDEEDDGEAVDSEEDGPIRVRRIPQPKVHCSHVSCIYNRNGPPEESRGQVSLYHITHVLNYHPANNDSVRKWCKKVKDFKVHQGKKSGRQGPGQRLKLLYVDKKDVEQALQHLAGHLNLEIPQGTNGFHGQQVAPRETSPEIVGLLSTGTSQASTVTPRNTQGSELVDASQFSIQARFGSV